MKNLILTFICILYVSNVIGQKNYPNPAAKYCFILGYDYEIITDAKGNQYGICSLPNGEKVNAWDFF